MKTALSIVAAFIVGLFVAATSAQLAAKLEQARTVLPSPLPVDE